ncbi:helix-turn-helix domain-containing protein [Streptomyces bluensis]|uniref:AraC-like ligand-binding domain-containing protein n=1 Tax=Streptomyces bluensis TaxID=33897 RepID=UPI0019CAC325|nr:helix-turn-helix domain-containing protein [Streptomyces bluensis]GGZ78277.1 AraC family transcriptional regulator [Streptomyces bluensis]
MIETVFRTDELPAVDRFAAWRERLGRTHAPMEVTRRDTSDYRAHQRVVELGNMIVSPMAMQPVAVLRTPKLIRQSDPELYHLSLIIHGTVGFTMSGPDATYGAYDLRTNDSSRPFAIHMDERQDHVACVGVEVPKARLPLPVRQVDRVIGRRLTGQHGVGALLSSFLTHLTTNTGSYTAADGPRLETVLADLLAALFAHELDAEDSLAPETHAHTMTLRIQSFIRQRLNDPDLTPAAVAAAHHISVSYLHRLFRIHGPGSTVAGFIRHHRLEQARRDLGDPAKRALPICDIAARWGFAHHAVFTRAFRAAYALAPSDYRHQTQTEHGVAALTKPTKPQDDGQHHHSDADSTG